MEHALKVSKTEAGKEGVLAFSGDITMEHAQETKKTLLEAIHKVDILHLDLHEIESGDVSFVQLICAAHRECTEVGKQFLLQGGIGGSMEGLLKRAGYYNQQGCVPGDKKSCLWGELHQK